MHKGHPSSSDRCGGYSGAATDSLLVIEHHSTHRYDAERKILTLHPHTRCASSCDMHWHFPSWCPGEVLCAPCTHWDRHQHWKKQAYAFWASNLRAPHEAVHTQYHSTPKGKGLYKGKMYCCAHKCRHDHGDLTLMDMLRVSGSEDLRMLGDKWVWSCHKHHMLDHSDSHAGRASSS